MHTTFLTGVDINIHNNVSLTPLHLACIKGYINIVNLLLHYTSTDSKERTLLSNDRDSNGPLQLAMFYGHEDVALAILKDSEQLVYLTRDQESTTLHIAAKYNLISIIEYLLER